MISKILILGIFGAILYTLASSFYFLVRDAGKGERTVKRLSWRVGLSLGLIVMLWIGFYLGWIEPQGVNPVQYPVSPDG